VYRSVALVVGVLALLGTGVLPASGAAAARLVATGGVKLTGTYILSGAVSTRGSFSDPEPVAKSCAQIGKDGTEKAFVGGPNVFAVPSPLLETSGKTESISFTAGVIYKRPGSFTQEDLVHGGGADLIVDKNSSNPVAATAKASMTVAANGSGTFTFSNAPPVAKGPSLSGKVSWICTT
jgi:hypothetical protein